VGAGRKELDVGTGVYQRVLARRGREEGVGGELWPGGGWEDGAVGRCSIRQRAEAAREMREMKASQGVKRGDGGFCFFYVLPYYYRKSSGRKDTGF